MDHLPVPMPTQKDGVPFWGMAINRSGCPAARNSPEFPAGVQFPLDLPHPLPPTPGRRFLLISSTVANTDKEIKKGNGQAWHNGHFVCLFYPSSFSRHHCLSPHCTASQNQGENRPPPPRTTLWHHFQKCHRETYRTLRSQTWLGLGQKGGPAAGSPGCWEALSPEATGREGTVSSPFVTVPPPPSSQTLASQWHVGSWKGCNEQGFHPFRRRFILGKAH